MNPKSIIDITVAPKSSRSKITVKENLEIKAYLNAPPVDGKANSELIEMFSKKLRVPKSNITIIAGLKSKKKRISIEGLTQEIILKKLQDG